jgi:hypothetical protein
MSCYGASVDDQAGRPVVSKSQDIIAGFAANNSALNAVGSIAIRYDYGYSDLICSAVLVGPSTALTARHCLNVLDYGYDTGTHVVFQIGPDARYGNAREVEIVAYEAAPPQNVWDGFTGRGNDLAAVHFADPVTDVTPLPWAALDTNTIGERYVAIGYGNQDSGGTRGTRRLGNVTLKATTGPTYGALFGNFADYFLWTTGQPLPADCGIGGGGDEDAGVPEAGTGGSGGGGGNGGRGGGGGAPGPDPWLCDWVRSLWDQYNYYSLDTYSSAVAGGAEGDAQPCYADDGGPLLRNNADDELTVYGVFIGGVSNSSLCERGGVYTKLDQNLVSFVETANAWVDPCADLSTLGQCDGTVAARCTSVREGARRRITFDCASVGLTCETQGDGSVGCGTDDQWLREPPYEPPVPPFDPVAVQQTAFHAPRENP